MSARDAAWIIVALIGLAGYVWANIAAFTGNTWPL